MVDDEPLRGGICGIGDGARGTFEWWDENKSGSLSGGSPEEVREYFEENKANLIAEVDAKLAFEASEAAALAADPEFQEYRQTHPYARYRDYLKQRDRPAAPNPPAIVPEEEEEASEQSGDVDTKPKGKPKPPSLPQGALSQAIAVAFPDGPDRTKPCWALFEDGRMRKFPQHYKIALREYAWSETSQLWRKTSAPQRILPPYAAYRAADCIGAPPARLGRHRPVSTVSNAQLVVDCLDAGITSYRKIQQKHPHLSKGTIGRLLKLIRA